MATKKAAQRAVEELQARINVLRDYTKLWQDYFQYFADREEGKKVTANEEAAFQQTVNVLALNHFRFVEMAGQHLKEGDAILKVLTETVSVAQIYQVSDAQLSKLQIDWHTTFIAMNKAIGKWMMQLPPPEPVQAA
jgi:hypothetical protein